MLSATVLVGIGLALTSPLAPTSLVHPAGSPPVRCAAARLTAATTSTDDEAGWAEFEAWMTRKKEEEEQEAQEHGRPSWVVTSTGHQHDHFFSNSAQDWQSLGAPPRLIDNLAELGIARPSCAQAAAYESVATGEDVIINHAAGTGKTLAFVAPLVQRLWELEAEHGRTPKGEVRAIIIVPTAELAQQVLTTARDVARRSMRASIATGEHSWSTQRKRLGSGLDLLVATMGRLVAHCAPRDGKDPSFSLRGTRAIIVDEADSLYQGEVPTWLQRKRIAHGDAPAPSQQEPPLVMWRWLRGQLAEEGAECATTLVTASLSTSVEEQLRVDVGLGIRALRGRGVHTTRPGVRTRLVDCTVPLVVDDGHPSVFQAKLDELLHALDEVAEIDGRPPLRTLVLCSAAATCERLARALHRQLAHYGVGGGRVLRFHSSLLPAQRAASLDAFRAPASSDGDEPPRILIATGRASKGLSFGEVGSLNARGRDGVLGGDADSDTGVKHVVLFDFPPDAKAHIARVGFATRGDAPAARVTALAVGKQLPFARAMLEQDKVGRAHGLDF